MSKALKFLKAVMPHGLLVARARFRQRKHQSAADDPDVLFDGDDLLFKQVLAGAQLYGEYGCGKSTKWVLNNSVAHVVSVDTSKEWIEEVQCDNRLNNERLTIEHADLGIVGSWGRPVSYDNRHMIREYTDFIWSMATRPDVVLIDGRFRVCCFLTSLKYAETGTKLLFDDYTSRAHYHVVEDYLKRADEYGRQCLFVVPEKSEIDLEKLDKEIAAFRYVMD